MSASWDRLRESLIPRVQEALGDAWDSAEIRAFAQKKLDEMAKDAWLALNADTEEARRVHKENLEDLWAHVKDESLKVARAAAGGFGDLVAEGLGLVLKTAAGVLLSSIEAKLGGFLP